MAGRLVDLPVERRLTPKGITVYPDGSSVEVHHGYTVMTAGPVVAEACPEEA